MFIMNDILKETIKLVPEQPGCYLYYNNEGEIIYVGKAKNLKKRVYSYFHKQHENIKTCEKAWMDAGLISCDKDRPTRSRKIIDKYEDVYVFRVFEKVGDDSDKN